ncbi:hypothetical protein KCP73_16535 [Salmonella enterica subsp. enterica]|nr:hypothetical protein KCP73_16535 [Salmonella enterica subsp. enterica]
MYHPHPAYHGGDGHCHPDLPIAIWFNDGETAGAHPSAPAHRARRFSRQPIEALGRNCRPVGCRYYALPMRRYAAVARSAPEATISSARRDGNFTGNNDPLPERKNRPLRWKSIWAASMEQRLPQR